jgi:crossover junction endodeoxyribonuclease RuvC
VVEGAPGRQLTAIAYGVVRTPSEDEISQRLFVLQEHVSAWIEAHQPEVVAVERVFSQHNVRTVMGTAQASAVAIVAAARAGVPVVMHTPSEVKAAVTGSGRADKAQVGHMVTRLLSLPGPPKPADTADALALAICHVWRGGAMAKLVDAKLAAMAGAR